MKLLRLPTLLLFLSWSALAATLQVAPLSLEIDLRQGKAGSTTLSNSGRGAAKYRVSVVRVLQDGSEQLVSAPEILLNPAVFTIEAGKRQVLRAGLTGAAPTGPETAYRMLVQQQPIPGDSSTVATLLTVGVPLYVRTRDGEAQVSFALARAGGGWSLVAKNTGGRRAVLANLALQGPSGALPLGSVVLVSGGTLQFALKELQGDGAGYSVVYQDAGGEKRAVALAAAN